MRKSNLRATAALQALALLGAGVTTAFIAAAPAAAQDVTAGALTGTVVNEAGNPIAGALVTINSNAGVTRTVTTSAGGTFTISQLPVGEYDVRINVEGKPTVLNENVAVTLGGSNYTFEVADTTAPVSGAESTGAEVVVTGRRIRTIDFSGTATGQVFNVQQVAEQVPIPRNIEAIQLLAPQTVSGDNAFGGVSIGGSSVAENIYYINGMNITNFRTFVGGTTVPFEFYDQVQVKTGGYQAEFGRNTGGAVIALSRSGSNEFKGGMNFTYAPDSLRADAPNTYSALNKKDVTRSAEGNVWVSGPIIKDRVFFFAFVNPRYAYSEDTGRSELETDDGELTGEYEITNKVTQRLDDPFWGGKVDVNLFDGHRLEGTYFNDKQSVDLDIDGSAATNSAGGANMIFKYTGAFTDWFTLSALYGTSKYNQTNVSAQDLEPLILDVRPGGAGVVAGNPFAFVESGKDSRKNYRLDADFNVNFFGKHRIRAGYDFELLNAENVAAYSGGIYYRFIRSGTGGALGGAVAPNTDYLRIRTYFSGGSFDSENTAYYLQDSWDVTDRINLSLGIRNDKFVNKNAAGVAFTELDNQWAPRLGINFDPFGDKRSRISAFYGRYYLPVAANTNLRLAGNEDYRETFYALPVDGSGNYNGSLLSPTYGAQLAQNIFSEGEIPETTKLVSKNLKPQYLDEYILGGEHRFENSRWSVGLNLTYRKLGAVLEDVDLDGTPPAYQYASIIEEFCNTQTLSFCNPAVTPSIGGSGYVLVNPGSDVIVNVESADGSLNEITIPNSFIKLPKAKRTYKAAEFKFERAFDGKWGLSGSYVLASSKGNYEGGVKSDIGQDDTGLTQDFDQIGWMDGANGYLPNHRRHTFKLYGAYNVTERFMVGFNALLQSPRKFGCIGTYPYSDGRADNTHSSSWYCKAQVEAGELDAGESTAQDPNGYLIGRGKAFNGDWNKRFDLSFAYKVPMPGLKDLTLRANVFNVFNFKSKLDFNEFGDRDDPDRRELHYGQVTSYQSPRFVRLGASINF